MNKTIGFIACLLGFSLCIFCGILAAVHVVGTDAELYHKLQMQAGILDSAGISEADLIRLDEALARCLLGEKKVLYLSCEVFGKLQPAFNSKELIHMEDCRQLFILLRSALWIAALLGAGFLGCGLYLLRDRRKIRLAAWLSPLVIAVPLGAFALWATVDFGAAFNFFHEILFTNDLWLLNAQTDLLIRLCPESMFMEMGARIGLFGLAWAFFLPSLATLLTAAKKERL